MCPLHFSSSLRDVRDVSLLPLSLPSVINMEVPTDHDLRVSMPITAMAKLTNIAPQSIRHAPRSRQSHKITMESLEITMQTGQIYRV